MARLMEKMANEKEIAARQQAAAAAAPPTMNDNIAMTPVKEKPNLQLSEQHHCLLRHWKNTWRPVMGILPLNMVHRHSM